MAKSLVGALALALAALPSAHAFRNTSPYFVFSTAALSLPADDAQVQRAHDVVRHIAHALDACPSKTYFVVRQSGVSAQDFHHAARSAPRLASHLNGDSDYVKSALVVSDVVDDSSAASAIAHHLRQTCGAQVLPEGRTANANDKQRIVHVSFAAPDADRHLRAAQLGQHDAELQQLISKHANFQDFTVIYTSTPQSDYQSEHPPYEMEGPFGDAMQIELKRDLSAHQTHDSSVRPKRAAHVNAGLFEKYQFFTPGLFMGLVAAVPLLMIVLVGVRALVSLEVSYFAFSKEMGPAAQRQQK